MLLVMKKSNCKHLKEISYYNHNFYKLPFELDECDIVEEVYDESWDSYIYVFGRMVNGKFISCFRVDSECPSAMEQYLIAFEALVAT